VLAPNYTKVLIEIIDIHIYFTLLNNTNEQINSTAKMIFISLRQFIQLQPEKEKPFPVIAPVLYLFIAHTMFYTRA
jgi:hypothetical protein